MKKLFHIHIPTWLGVVILLSFFAPLAFAINTVSSGYKVTKNGGSEMIDTHGICKVVTNNSTANDYFVPTKSSVEWSDFISGKPGDIGLGECGIAGSGCGACPYGFSDPFGFNNNFRRCNGLITADVSGPACVCSSDGGAINVSWNCEVESSVFVWKTIETVNNGNTGGSMWTSAIYTNDGNATITDAYQAIVDIGASDFQAIPTENTIDFSTDSSCDPEVYPGKAFMFFSWSTAPNSLVLKQECLPE